MDQSTYTNLTGKTVDNTDRFNALSRATKAQMEDALGWPLCPDDWGNQYIEIGKTRDDCSCSDVDTSDLDDPDEVVSSYRLFSWEPLNIYLPIDPATTIHAVKLVRNGVTHRTLESEDYRVHYHNSRGEAYAKYIEIDRSCVRLTGCDCTSENVQVAIDADWAFQTLPYALRKLWADGIAFGLDDKANIRSESLGSHSWSKFAPVDPVVAGSSILASYAGPNGTSYATVRSA